MFRYAVFCFPRFCRAIALLVLLVPFSAWPAGEATNITAAAAGMERRATQIDLSGEATVTAANDLARATAFAEASGPTPGGATAQEVNRQIEAALAKAKKYPQVSVRSGNISAYPEYNSKSSVKSWRVRSELLLETRDMTALSALLGELQETLGIAELRLMPAPETRQKAEDEAILKAMAAFKERAALMAGAMGKSYAIRRLVLNGSSSRPLPGFGADNMVMQARKMAAPVEAGESQVSVMVGGTIELVD